MIDAAPAGAPGGDAPLRLLTVHAHPDDESSKGAATVARYTDEGVRAVLVCCTGGEEGDILNPAADLPGVRERLAEVRRAELERAAAIIGYHEVLWLGYRDSGYPEAPEVHDGPAEPVELPAGSFGAAPLEEATERLVAILRAERPHVVVIYPDDQQGYRHPDHLRVHEVGLAAYEAAGDPLAFPAAGAPWRPTKLYYSLWSKARMLAFHAAFGELGLQSPYEEWWFERPWQDHRITTRIEVAKWYDRRCDALLAHETQVDPDSPFWFGLPRDVAAAAYPCEDYILASADVATELPEDDLFAGLRAPGGSRAPGVEDFGSEGWLAGVRAAAEALPAVPGCGVRARLEVSGGPGGPCRLGVVVVDGRLVELSPGRLADPDCTVSCGAADAQAILSGELDPAVAYMQGRLKIDGAYERVLFGLRPLIARDAFGVFAAGVRAPTSGGGHR